MSDVEKRLNEFLDSGQDDRFTVDNDEMANWALRKIKQLNNELHDVGQVVQAEVFKLEQFHNAEKSKKQESIDYFQSLLSEYAANKRLSDPKFKSLKLPNGYIGYRKQQPKWNYDDETLVKALEDAELNDYIKISKAPIKADIKKLLNVVNGQVVNPQTGEFIEGITVEERPDNFNVRVE